MSAEGEFPEAFFNQGIMGVRKSIAKQQDYVEWEFRTDVTDLIDGLGGGQLSDLNDNCLAFTEFDNYEDSQGIKSTRVQVVPCIHADDIDVNDPEQVENFKKQVVSIELGDSLTDLYYIRFACTDKVIKKIKSSGKHDDKVFDGQLTCQEQHFDFELVDKSECVGDHKFGVNDCAFAWNDLGEYIPPTTD